MGTFTAQEILDEIERQAPVFGIEPRLAQAFFHAENSADGRVDPGRKINGATTSKAGARGVMQTMPATEEGLKRLGFLPKDWQYNPADMRGQVQAGLAALQEKRSRQKNKDDVMELAALYNGGNAVAAQYRAGRLDEINPETSKYFTKIKTALGPKMPMTPQQMESYVAPAASRSTGMSTSSSSFSTGYDPLMVAATLQEGYSLIKAGGNVDVATNSINAAIAQRQAAEQSQAASIAALGQARGASIAAETEQAASAAARRTSILSRANVNPDDVSNLASMAMADIMTTTAEAEAEASEIDKRMAVGIFDNPLQWLVNQTRLPGMVGSYNAKVEKVNRSINTAKSLQALASDQISLSAGLDADLITKTGAAKAAEAAAVAQDASNQAQQAIAGNAIRDSQLALAISGEKFQTLSSMTELTARARAERAGSSEREIGQRAEELALGQVNKWLKMIGSTQQYDAGTFKMIPQRDREMLISASGTGRIGNKLADSVAYIEQLGNSRNMAAEGDAAAIAWVQATVTKAKANVGAELKIAKDQARISGKPVNEAEFLTREINKMQDLYQAETLDMRTASDTNPIRIDYTAMLKDPAVRGNLVTNFVSQFGPTAENPVMQRIDEKLMLQKITADIALGKTDSKTAAADIAKFYKTGAAFQVNATKYPLFGLDTPLNGYTVNIPEAGMFDKPMAGGVIDLTNQAAVETYLIRNTAIQVRNIKGIGAYRPFVDPLGLIPKTGAPQ